MESKVQKAKKNADIAEENDGVTAEKIKFPLYVFPETMKTVDILYKSDNCSSRTEFMEKAIRFYCGYLLQNKPELVDYLAPQIATLTEGIVKGTEQRLSRALFKVAVELGAISHMLAAVHDIDDDTMIKLRAMCTDEVKRINGIINFEKTVRYQRAEEEKAVSVRYGWYIVLSFQSNCFFIMYLSNSDVSPLKINHSGNPSNLNRINSSTV